MTGALVIAGATPSADQPWPLLPGHREWLDAHARSLTQFARGSVRGDGGFWWLDDRGQPDPSEPLHTWIACRMTHVFALGYLRGEEDTARLIDHGIAALSGLLRDQTHGGWFSSVGPDGTPVDETKAAYPHAFVVLAASSAVRAGRPGARALLDDALSLVSERFWDEAAGRTRESWSADWQTEEAYRGANSSMHMVEAFLAAGDATGDTAWFDRALRICEHLIHDVAADRGWRLPEHFSPDWVPDLDYNIDQPADPFRPYGYTIGHALEWARLLLHVEASVSNPPAWLLDDARSLFASAVHRGWSIDGSNGFVYTCAWDDTPVVRSRMHWVFAEAIAAADALRKRTGEGGYEEWYRTFWEFVQRYVLDDTNGSWRHELDATNVPAATVWRGKPDVYHAYQATLFPLAPLGRSLAGELAMARTPGSSG